MWSPKEEDAVGGYVDGSGPLRVRVPCSSRMDQTSFHNKATEGVTNENDGSLEGFLQLQEVSIWLHLKTQSTGGHRQAW